MNACHGVALRGVLPLPLSCKTLTFVTGIIRRDRKTIGSRWRKLKPGQHLGESPVQGQKQAGTSGEANRVHAKLRAPGERANAQLKTWNILDKLRRCPWRAGKLAKAIHVLQLGEA
jgi:hypothetical protein